MTNSIKISQLPAAATPLTGAEEVALVQGGVTKQATVTDVTTVTATGSTTARSLADRAADAVNVKDFGAVGDGVTDDTAAFNAAIATGDPVYIPTGNYRLNGSVTSLRRLYATGASFSGAGTVDPYPAFGEGSFKTYATGNHNSVIGIADNNNPAATLAFPTGVTGYARYSNAGNTAFGIFGRADCLAAGVATNELNSFNYAAAPTSSLPADRSIGTTQIVPVALTVASGGTYPSAIGIEISKEGGEPQPFYTGVYLNSDSYTNYGVFIDASAATTGTPLVVKHNINYPAINIIGSGTPIAANGVLSYTDGNNVLRFAIKQDGRLYFSTGISQTTVGSAGAAAAPPSNPTGYLKVEIGGSIKLIPYYES
jgi:hypothetical protein